MTFALDGEQGAYVPEDGASSAWANSWTAADDFTPQTISLVAGDRVVLIGAINHYADNLQVLVNGSPVGPLWTFFVSAFGCDFTAPATGDYTFDLDGSGSIDEAGAWIITRATT